MNILRSFGITVLSLSLAACTPENSEQPTTTRSGRSEQSKSEVREDLIAFLEAKVPALLEGTNATAYSVVAVDSRNTLWLETSGHTDRSESRVVDEDTLFRIRSITKSFTALAVLNAVQDGLLDLDMPIEHYLPGFSINTRFRPSPEERITLRQLLTHWAGLADNSCLGDVDLLAPSLEERVSSFSQGWLRYPVGHRWAYSSQGTDLAGYLLEHISGVSFAEYLRAEVLEPIGMDESTMILDELLANENRAAPISVFAEDLPDELSLYPSAGLYASISDMAKYLRFHLNTGRVDDDEVLSAELLKKEMYAVAFPMGNQSYGYALGLERRSFGNDTCLSHSGGGLGFSSGMVFCPDLGFGAVILVNSDGNMGLGDDFAWLVGEGLLAATGETEPVGPSTCPPADVSPLSKDDERVLAALGWYRNQNGQSRGLELRDGRLFLTDDDGILDARLFECGGKLMGVAGANLEFWFFQDHTGANPTMVIHRRDLKEHWFFDYHDGPNDPSGPAKGEWQPYIGKYRPRIFGNTLDVEIDVEMKDGYLYLGGERLVEEMEPGLFFRYDGAVVDFRGDVAMTDCIPIIKKGAIGD